MPIFMDCLVDIFGVPLEYITPDARRRAFARLCKQISGFGFCNCSFPFVSLLDFVHCGFLSLKSASYFLTGRCSVSQLHYLSVFKDFYENCMKELLSDFKILMLWQKQENAVPENTFLFPLAELDSEPDLSTEVDTDFDLKDLQKIF